MDANKVRLEGLERVTDEVSQKLMDDSGLMRCDLEVLGAILLTRHKGEDNRLDEMFENTTKLLQQADELLANLRSGE